LCIASFELSLGNTRFLLRGLKLRGKLLDLYVEITCTLSMVLAIYTKSLVAFT
jgi:hypothetical protein